MRLIIIFFTLAFLPSCKQGEKKEHSLDLTASKIQLGDSSVYLVKNEGSTDQVLLMNVHENEQTAIGAMLYGGSKLDLPIVYLHQNKQRRIAFSANDTVYSIDPNRIYTDTGRVRTLKDSMNYSLFGLKQTKKIADIILQEIDGKEWLITLHNNTDSNYSILSYAEGGGEAQNAGELFMNEKEDPDDFVYTTDKTLFEFLKSRNVNVVLQSSNSFIDDGSLSIYCGLHGIRYANIETQHAHLSTQIELLNLLVEFLGC
jgi:hypothetical protein